MDTELRPLLLIVGESGTGKTTITDYLKNYGMNTVKSFTTRQKRQENDNDHKFITMKEYMQLTDVAAATYFDGNYYGATKQMVDEAQTYIIDLDGINYFKNHYNSDRDIKVVLIEISPITKFYRLCKRDGLKKTISRIKHDKQAFKNAEDYADLIVKNKNYKLAAYEILDYYTELLLKTRK